MCTHCQLEGSSKELCSCIMMISCTMMVLMIPNHAWRTTTPADVNVTSACACCPAASLEPIMAMVVVVVVDFILVVLFLPNPKLHTLRCCAPPPPPPPQASFIFILLHILAHFKLLHSWVQFFKLHLHRVHILKLLLHKAHYFKLHHLLLLPPPPSFSSSLHPHQCIISWTSLFL